MNPNGNSLRHPAGDAGIGDKPRTDACPEAVARLRLDAPGWLEASAGSGKTYALEHLVTRLLRENPGLSLGGIALVTFTEKAAGELKEKIRRRLEKEAARPDLSPGARLRLQEAWLHFDRASVHTLHGFCLQALRRYAFELGGLFEATLVAERSVLESSLLELRRRAAAKALPPELTEALVKVVRSDRAAAVRKYAAAFRPDRGDTLEPIPDPEALPQSHAEAARLIGMLGGLFLENPGESLEKQAWFAAFAALFKGRKGKGGYDRRLKAFEELRNHLLQCGLDPEPWLEVFSDKRKALVKDGPGLFKTEGLPDPDPELNRRLLSLRELMQTLPAALRKWKRAKERSELAPIYLVLQALGENSARNKTDQGLLTYDDMALRLWQALACSPELVDLLRRQYPVALVDEFQDTDPMQWAIFEKLYLEAHPPLPLYLVGDPKQAIYGFRGGDLATYLRARRRLFGLSQNGQALGFGLDANFRSRADLLDAMNTVFSGDAWFLRAAQAKQGPAWQLPAENQAIAFTPARFGDSPRQACSDKTFHPEPVVLYAPPEEEKQEACDRFVAGSITELLRHPETLLIPGEDGKPRPLHAGDICVLLRKHQERQGLERWFRLLNIPYRVYKQDGLFRSEEAGHLAAILSALAHPTDAERQIAANLSLLLRDNPLESPSSDVMHPLLVELRPLAEAGLWPALFRRLFREGGAFERLGRLSDGAERLGRLRQLAQRLSREAQAAGHDLIELAHALGRWRLAEEEDLSDGEGDIQRVADEAPKVTLLTMHASKGLEFPVVFIAYGTGGTRLGLPRSRHAEDLGWTFFLEEPEGRQGEAWRRESEDEDKRLFYVAFTRARFKLYIPLLPPAPQAGEEEKDGHAGKLPPPLAGFASLALHAAAAARPELFHIENLPFPLESGFIQGLAHDQKLNETEHKSQNTNSPGTDRANPFPAPEAAGPPPLPQVLARRRRLASYSQLAKQRKSIILTEAGRRLEPDEWEAMASASEQGPRPALPPGARTGNMLHDCLEHLDFAWAAPDATRETFLAGPAGDLIARQLRLHDFPESLVHEAGSLIHATLTTPLPDAAGGPDFTLSQIEERLPEMEFLLPYAEKSGAMGGAKEDFPPMPPFPDIRQAHGYLWGYIDLVFRHRGRYYALDWKSNWLGDYAPEALRLDMEKEAYDLQGRLYAVAVHRWLQARLKDYAPTRDFGGIYYLYLRGLGGAEASISPASGGLSETATVPRSGVVSWRPTEADLDIRYPAYLAETMGLPASALQAWKAREARETRT